MNINTEQEKIAIDFVDKNEEEYLILERIKKYRSIE